MLHQRLLFGALMIAGIVGIVSLDAWLSQRGLSAQATGGAAVLGCALPMALLVVFLAVLATYEMNQLCVAGGYRPAVNWVALVSGGLAFLPWLEMQRRLSSAMSPLFELDLPLELWWLACGLLGTCLAVLLRKTTERALGNMAMSLFLVLYLGLLGSFAVRIRCLWPGPAGALLVVYFILTVKAGDIGAYFTGLMFGRHKLVPWLSPGKTVEGAVGALVYATLVAGVGTVLWSRFPVWGPPPVTLMQALIFGVVMAVAGHLGDLTESAFKRDVGIKDSGRVVPAFGGLLDILDSPLFAAPIAWWLLTIWLPTR